MKFYIQIVIKTSKKNIGIRRGRRKYTKVANARRLSLYFFWRFCASWLYFNEHILLDNQGNIERKNNFNFYGKS